MRIDQLPDLHVSVFELRPVFQGTVGTFQAKQEVELHVRGETGREFLLSQGKQQAEVACSSAAQQAQLSDLLRSGAPLVAWLVHQSTGYLVVQAHRFRSGLLLGELPLLIEDHVLDELKRRFRVSGTPQDVHRWIIDRVQIDPDASGRHRIVVQSGDDPEGGFRILGRGLCLDIERREGQPRVRRLVAAGGSGPVPQLIWARLRCVDVSAGAALADSARALLAQALSASDSYLELWRHYQTLDEEIVRNRAREFGAIAYRGVSARGKTLRFDLCDRESAASKIAHMGEDSVDLEASTDSNLDLSSEPAKGKKARKTRPWSGRFVRVSYDGRGLELEAPEDGAEPPPEGYLKLSVHGDEVRLKRRRQAEERIRSGNIHLPHIGLLLEGKPLQSPRYAHRSPGKKSLTDSFRAQPSDRQMEAIRVALNTPDIALIQGPPGTGKTQVITALQRCLAEQSEQDGKISRILVTSTQHEAVNNVVARTEVFGLPAVKVGHRRGESEYVDSVERWRLQKIETLETRAEQLSTPEKLSVARYIALRCLLAPSSAANQLDELRQLKRLCTGQIAPELIDLLRALVHRLGTSSLPDDLEERALMRKAVNAIRIQPGAFEDDGPLQAEKALRRLKTILTSEERAFLEACASWSDTRAPGWLEERGGSLIDGLRERVLAQTSTEAIAPAGLSPEEQKTLRRIIDAMNDAYRSGQGGEMAVVSDFLEDLQSDPQGLREALQHYTVVLGATCQHASGEKMLAAMELADGSVQFDSVIVDEAARSHPLDLFIPMTLARRRIVLVGDQRQLPHMLEPDVERAFLASQGAGEEGPKETPEPLKESLFARLWTLLKQLEREDGQRRVVTLDIQFRMHPSLGTYLSQQFYEQGPPEQRVVLKSGRPASDFVHTLSRYQREGRPCCAAWVDVHGSQGREEQVGRSKGRRAEARKIAREVQHLLGESQELTLGVIAFYSAQVRMVLEELEALGITEKTEDGELQIRDEYRLINDRQGQPVERIRVGTVDAFQGKEFDVVLLSVTRSNDLPDQGEEQLRRKFGHLLLPNRLCVAMSRQRRLLIVFGDKAFVRKARVLPQLHAFLQLCEGPDGCLL